MESDYRSSFGCLRYGGEIEWVPRPEQRAAQTRAYRRPPEEVKKTTEKVNSEIKITNVKGQDIELPPKNGKVELEEFDVPNITCNCSGSDEVCPVCE